ncbi:MAG: FAD-binding oxidoreductase [Gammaproteobacteria bacterium]|nr:FAD-binding oxidoreductase [Gammaproteobacteria bacterium]
MLRRELLKTLGAGALTVSTGACAPMSTTSAGFQRPYSRKPFVAPRISRENVIREVVGHRPYRAKGFVVRSEKLGDKVVVHNYGHGGSGISLSWGSSALAVRETLGMEHRDVAVIGSGVMGLTSVRLLQDAGWNVTIYTRDMARHATSNVAGGEWAPGGAHDPDVSTDVFKSRLMFAARIAHHAYTNLGGADYGIRWLERYRPSNEMRDPSASMFSDLYPYEDVLGPGEHPFPTTYCGVAVTMIVEPARLLRRLTEDVHQAGGTFVIRNFDDKEELLTLPEPVIFNCTGLGARALFGDEDLVPAKGQLLFMPPDPDVDYLTSGGGEGRLYMYSRSDVLLLGTTFKPGDWSTNPEPEETERILREHQRLFAGI